MIHFHGQQRPDIDVLQARFAFVPNERLGYFKEFDSGYKSVLQPQRHAFQKALDFHARHHDSALVDTLYRSLSFYVSAFHAEAVDVRFLTLWIALESLVKEVSEEKVYQRLEAGILPSLVSNRVNKITTYAAIALQENGALSPQQGERTNARHLKQSSPRFVEPVEVLHMLCFSERKKDSTTSKKPKYENQEIGELFGRCDEHVLLKHRLNSLWASMTERTTVHAQLNRSYQRSLWQLRRMYSARNLLVHHGIKSKHLEYLLKNLEYYYTSMVMHIMHDLQRTPHGFSSLASVLEARKWKWIENQRALKKDNGLALRAADFRMRSDHPDVSDEPLWER